MNKSLSRPEIYHYMKRESLTGIEAIIFDLGGTLWQGTKLPVFEIHKRFVKKVCGEDFQFTDEALAAALDKAYKEFSDTLSTSNVGPHYELTDEDWTRHNFIILRELGVTEQIEELAKQYQQLWNELIEEERTDLTLREGILELLEELKRRGYKLGVATNWYDPSENLKRLNVFDFFQSIQWTLVEGYAKPSPYMLMLNAHELEVNPLKCVFVGDCDKRDVPAAKRAGMVPILYVWDPNSEPDVDNDVIIIEDMRDILEILH